MLYHFFVGKRSVGGTNHAVGRRSTGPGSEQGATAAGRREPPIEADRGRADAGYPGAPLGLFG